MVGGLGKLSTARQPKQTHIARAIMSVRYFNFRERDIRGKMFLWMPLGGDNGNNKMMMMLLLFPLMTMMIIKAEKVKHTTLDPNITRLEHTKPAIFIYSHVSINVCT